MRRCRALATLAALLLLAGCTPDDPGPEPGPQPPADDEEASEEPLPTGLRIGVVLPSRELGSADEIAAGELGLDALATAHRDEVSELRTLVPDAEAFVPDLASLLVAEDYDLVCVLGRGAGEIVLELARRHAATQFCGAPAEPADDPPPNLYLVDLALEELGHVVGVALGRLGGEDPVALLGAGNRAGGESFRTGLRAGVGATPLREARGGLEELGAELEAAVDGEVAAIAVDAGPEAAELVGGIGDLPLLAPVPLLSEQDAGALRWRVRFEVVVEAVLVHLLDAETELPAVLGMGDEVFAVDHGPQAGAGLVSAVEEVMGELERGERDPLEAPGEDEPGEASGQQDASDEDVPDDAPASPAEP